MSVINTISQVMSSIPLLRHRSTVNPSSQSDKDDFVAKYEATNDHLANNTVSEMNTFRGQLNTTAGQINIVSSEVATNASQAQTARDEAVAAVATLPEGIISDGTTSATDTWSSEKISSEIQSISSNSVTLAQVQATALSF